MFLLQICRIVAASWELWSHVLGKPSCVCVRRIILLKDLVETVLVCVLSHFSNCFRLDNRLVCDQPYDCAGLSGDAASQILCWARLPVLPEFTANLIKRENSASRLYRPPHPLDQLLLLRFLAWFLHYYAAALIAKAWWNGQTAVMFPVWFIKLCLLSPSPSSRGNSLWKRKNISKPRGKKNFNMRMTPCLLPQATN